MREYQEFEKKKKSMKIVKNIWIFWECKKNMTKYKRMSIIRTWTHVCVHIHLNIYIHKKNMRTKNISMRTKNIRVSMKNYEKGLVGYFLD